MNNIYDIIKFNLSVEFAISSTIAMSVLLLLLIIWLAGRNNSVLQIRDTVIDRHQFNIDANFKRIYNADLSVNVHSSKYFLEKIIAIFPKYSFLQINSISNLLASRNFFLAWIFFISKLFSLIFLLLLIILFFVNDSFFIRNSYDYFVFIFVILLFFFPDIIIDQKRKKRLKSLYRGLPDALDLLVICAEAGLSLDTALQRVADEFATVYPELSEEFSLTFIELSFLHERRQALINLSKRVELPSFRGVVTTLIQTEKYGTPLAQALRTLSYEFRENRLLDAEERAARLPAILTIPMIIFILPALFIVIAAPAFISIFQTF